LNNSLNFTFTWGSFQVWSASAGGVTDTYIYGNTIYSPTKAFAFNGDGSGFTNLKIYNNIFITTSSPTILDISSSVGLDLSGNLFWNTGGGFQAKWNGTMYTTLQTWQSASGFSHDFSSDPNLLNLGNGLQIQDTSQLRQINAYNPILPNSFVIGKGTSLANYGIDVGPYDYLGKKTHLPLDIGAILSEWIFPDVFVAANLENFWIKKYHDHTIFYSSE